MKKHILLILGLILVMVAFLINVYSLFRILLLALGLLLITLSFVYRENKSLIFLILLPLILMLLSYGLDNFLFTIFDKIPIFVLEEKSSDKVSTYNSFFYRIFDCDGSLILDYRYQKDFACATSSLEAIDINTFIPSVLSNSQDYQNKFYKIKGKISKISGIDTIELSLFEESTDSLNGFVSFNNSSLVKVKTNTSLSKFRIYDEIEVIGLVKSITKENDNNIITLDDVILIPSTIYDTYSYEVITSKSTEQKDFIKAKNYYLYGIDNIYVNYNETNKYELSYVMLDERILLSDLITTEPNEIKEEEKLLAKLYNEEEFNILVCENVDKTFLMNKSLKYDIEICK